MARFPKLRRMKEIGLIMAKYGLASFLPAPILTVFGSKATVDGEKSFKSLSIEGKLRHAFEEIGPTTIKLGQLLSIRPDLVPQTFVDEFQKLQDSVKAVPFEKIKPIIEEELMVPIEDVFSSFNEKEIASASISQVYEGILEENGEEVVIKVRKPGIVETIKGDTDILFWIADVMQKNSSYADHYDFKGIVEEFFLSVKDELDLLIEKKNTEKFNNNFSGDEWGFVKFPKIYDRYSTSSILVMEKVYGKKLYQIDEIEDVNREIVAERGAYLFMKMVFEDGFFHSDLHGGNIFFSEMNKIVIIDCGMCGALDTYTRELIAEMFIAFGRKDYTSLANIYIELSDTNVDVDKKALTKDIRKVIDSLPEQLSEIKTSQLLQNLSSILYKHKLKVPRNLTLLGRGISMIEGVGRELAPKFDLIQASQSFAATLLKMKYSPEKIADKLLTAAIRLIDISKNLPEDISEIVEKIEKGKLQHRILFLLSRKDKSFSSRMVTRVSTAFIMTGSMVSFKTLDNSAFSIFIYTVFGISLLLFLLSFRKEKNEKD